MFYAKSHIQKANAAIPVLFVLTLIGFIYYVFIFEWALQQPPTLFIAFLAYIVSSLLFMILWTYFQTLITDPGTIPDDWDPSKLDEEKTLTFNEEYDKESYQEV
jgi:hypothetical protein